MKIEELQFSVRTYHALKRAGINTVEQLQRMTDDDLYRLNNIGKLTVAEIRFKVPYTGTEKSELPTMTNADRIRAMNNYELAVFLAKVKAQVYRADLYVIAYSTQDMAENLQWLQQREKEG